MAGPKVTVITDSDIVRENVAVALGARHPLAFVPPGRPPEANTAVLICDCPGAAADAAAAAARGVPTIRVVTAGSAGAGELSFPFFPESLRAAVRRALEPPATRATPAAAPIADGIDFPLIPAAAAAVAATAAASGLPALICGARGTGTRRLARQIHARGGGGRFLAVPAAGLSPAIAAALRAGGSERITLCLDGIDALPAGTAEVLAALLDDGTIDHAGDGVRLLCTAEADAESIVTTSGIDPELFYRLAVLPIQLEPLRARSDEIPAIATAILARLAARHAPAAAAPVLTPDAAARLRRYPWPGNLVELEAVLARTLVFCRAAAIGADDLVFDIATADSASAAPRVAAVQPPAATPVPAAAPATTPDGADAGLELLLQDLAHEFKNPMVTIKTTAQLLERQLDAESGQREMARMTGEAVDRMDRALENLLAWTRFAAPVRHPARLADVVSECLEALDAELVARRILLDDRVDPGTIVVADHGQLGWALDNLLRAAIRAAGDGATLVLRTPLAHTGLVLQLPTSTASVTAALARWSDGAAAPTTVAASIGFVLARTLIERNGGTVRVQAGEGETTLTVTLPAGDEEAEEDEEAAYPDR